MATIGSLNVLLGLKHEGFTKSIKHVRSEMKTLNDAVGTRSALKNMMEMMAGGGALAGIGMLANSFERSTGRMAELRRELNAGAISMAQFRYEMGKSIPIFGQFVQGFENV